MIAQEAIAAPRDFHLRHQSSRCHKVLVVDDNDAVRHVLVQALSLIGCDVIEASNGLEAFERFQRLGADLVVTDLQMPVMNGYDLIECLKRIAPRTPIVIITGQAPSDDPAAINPCVKAVLHKPFPLKKLQQVARNAMGHEKALLA